MYKVTLKSQMFIVKELGSVAIPLAIVIFIIAHFYPDAASTIGGVSIAAFFVLEVFPAAIVHYQYLKYNEDMILKVNTSEKTIVIEEKGVKHTFRFDQIKNIRLALMADLYNGYNRGMAASAVYHYAFIETDNGDKFIITCLLINDLRKYFKDIGLKYTKDKIFFPTVRMGRYKEKVVKV